MCHSSSSSSQCQFAHPFDAAPLRRHSQFTASPSYNAPCTALSFCHRCPKPHGPSVWLAFRPAGCPAHTPPWLGSAGFVQPTTREPHALGARSAGCTWWGRRLLPAPSGRSFYSLSMLCTHTHTRTHCGLHSMQQLVLQQPLLRSLLFWRWSCELGSGRFSRGTRCITVVLPSGSCSAPRVTLPCRKRPW